ncbi:sulfatase-like hydrolase/transferase [bacterium]|nr:sulfatase-like hydrolase/transferase [bacterium]
MPRTPNILWIMTDQQRADALGCVTPWMHTPHMDRLAAQGAHVRTMFAQSPVCVPSRVNFITGRYPHSHRVRENRMMCGPFEPHLFRVLKRAGYRLGIAGKNHMFYKDELANMDVDATRADQDLPDTTEAEAYRAHIKQVNARMSSTGCWAGACFHEFPEEFTRTHRTGAAAVKFIEEQPAGQPFFLWASFADPHAPHTAPARFAQLYPPDRMPVPPGALAGETGAEVGGKPSRQAIKRKAQGMVEAPEEGVRRYVAVYSAMISFVDEWVGRILDALDARGMADNTIVVFTADHGDFRGEHGMVKKDLVLYDCLLNIPFIMRYPRVIAPRRVEGTLAEQVDILPTLLDYAGIPSPDGLQGRSMRPLLDGKTDRWKDEVFAEICPPDYRNPYRTFDAFMNEWRENRETPGHLLQWTASFNVPGEFVKAVRTRTRKYVWYAHGEEELYDLANDPGETVNRADDPAYAADKQLLKLRLLEWHALSEDPLDPARDRAIAKDYPWTT